MSYHVKFLIEDEAALNYLDASARIRRTSRAVLVETIFKIILSDQLILSVLDDGDSPGTRCRVDGRRNNGRGRPRKQRLHVKEEQGSRTEGAGASEMAASE